MLVQMTVADLVEQQLAKRSQLPYINNKMKRKLIEISGTF